MLATLAVMFGGVGARCNVGQCLMDGTTTALDMARTRMSEKLEAYMTVDLDANCAQILKVLYDVWLKIASHHV